MTTAIDWATRPAPWCWIGPQLASECRLIAAGKSPEAPEFRPVKPQRKHRDAVPLDPQHQQAVAERQVEVATVKERLQIDHELHAAGVTRPRRGGRYSAERVAK